MAVLAGKYYKGLYSLGFQNVAVGRINGVAALTGFYYKKMYGHFAGTKISGRNNEVAVRRVSTVLTSTTTLTIPNETATEQNLSCIFVDSITEKIFKLLAYQHRHNHHIQTPRFREQSTIKW